MADSALLLEFLDADEGSLRIVGTWRIEDSDGASLYARQSGCDFRRCADASCKEFELSFALTGATEAISFHEGDGTGFKPVDSYASGRYFPLHESYSRAYCVRSGWLCRWHDGALRIERATASGTAMAELAFCRELWSKNLVGGRKAILLRMLVNVYRRLSRRKVLLVSDRPKRAGDNGEAFFRFLRANKAKVRAFFVLSRGSADWRRVSRVGRTVEPFSYMHKLILLSADYAVSSQADRIVHSPFDGWECSYRDMLGRKRFVFLQHGVIKDDLSAWLRRRSMNIFGFVTSARRERQSIVDGDYGYADDAIWLTGLPRHDLLDASRASAKRVVVMPTWRKWLVQGYDPAMGVGRSVQGFEDSAYFRFYHALLNDTRLADAVRCAGFELCFMPHPQFQRECFDVRPGAFVKVLDSSASYCEVLSSSALVVTDYSSVAFDFAYLRKPVVYAQFDEAEFFSGLHVYAKGYFDYRRDGFGEVATTLDQTVELVSSYVENGCRMKDEYLRRADGFFAYSDKGNCRRVYECMLAHDASLPEIASCDCRESGEGGCA